MKKGEADRQNIVSCDEVDEGYETDPSRVVVGECEEPDSDSD